MPSPIFCGRIAALQCPHRFSANELQTCNVLIDFRRTNCSHAMSSSIFDEQIADVQCPRQFLENGLQPCNAFIVFRRTDCRRTKLYRFSEDESYLLHSRTFVSNNINGSLIISCHYRHKCWLVDFNSSSISQNRNTVLFYVIVNDISV